MYSLLFARTNTFILNWTHARHPVPKSVFLEPLCQLPSKLGHEFAQVFPASGLPRVADPFRVENPLVDGLWAP
jgi:hypothetical protein